MEMRKIMSEQTVRKIRLKGHETFILREGWLAKGLKAVSDNPKVFSEYAGADALGVGTNMAKAIRYWLRAGGVTAESKGEVRLSAMGRLIKEYVPTLRYIYVDGLYMPVRWQCESCYKLVCIF